MDMTLDLHDIKILTFIYDRLINHYGENESYDYMTSFKKVIEKLIRLEQ